MKIVKAELENEVHTRFKVWCVQQGWGMGEAIERLILERTGGHKYPVRAPAEERKQPSKAFVGSAPHPIMGEAPKESPDELVTFKKGQPPMNPDMPEWVKKSGGKVSFGVPVDTSEVKMSKCRKCGESFPVADMVTEPKSGKLFCGDCVENMKNGQA